MARFAAVLLALVLAAPAAAQWPTTDWVVMDAPGGDLADLPFLGGEIDALAARFVSPVGDRAVFAAKHEGILEAASRWFESLQFSTPLQITEDLDLEVEAGEAYLATLKRAPDELGSSHGASGYMRLSNHPGFLAVDTPVWTLMEASAVHELYHGIQKGSSPSLVRRMESRPAELGACPGDTDLDWLVEGTAAMVQIRWLEGQIGPWGHPFKGSTRAAWVREFDQPLHRGALAGEHLMSRIEPEMTSMETVSWACDYGTWYFWYAVGDMIGRTDAEKVSYTQFLFNGVRPWDDGGIANADIGLKAAAAAYDAIAPYRDGLYDLYPEFVAQYLTEDRFYGGLGEVELGAPGLFETTAADSGGPLGPLASRAWRVRVRLPANTTSIPYTVRFTLDALDGTDRDALHLIVDEDVAGRPVDDTAPYVAVERTDLAQPADGAIEYLVRVANVAEDAGETEDAAFSLRIEVDGFYGGDVAGGPSAGGVGGELPPGFAVRGPAAWTCRGGSDARAVFDLMTPDELGRDVDRALPEMVQDMGDMMDNLEIMVQRLERQGRAAGMSSEQIAELRREAEAAMEQARTETRPDIDRAADEMRARRVTELLATFVGQEGGAECQMTLGATLVGREGGAQSIPGAIDPDRYPEDEKPGFDIIVFPQSFLEMMRSGIVAMTRAAPGTVPSELLAMEDPYDGWTVCTMTDEERRRASRAAARSECPPVLCTAGQLVLERAEQGRIAGTFQFEVLKWPEESGGQCHVPSGRDTVVGHFNVASTDDGYDDNSLGGFGLGIVPGLMPGSPILNLGDLD